jgi:hypothetical protein
MTAADEIFFSKLYFSYSQFFVYDQSVKVPECDWTARHFNQGFARRESSVSFGTLLEFGRAELSVRLGAFKESRDYQRVIAVPFLVTSGRIVVGGPEEFDNDRSFALKQGHYCLVAAQHVTGDDNEDIRLFLELRDSPLAHSEIIIADETLNPMMPLLETADVPMP